MAGFNFSIDRVVQKAIRDKLKGVARNLDKAQASAANRSAKSTVSFFSKETRKEVNVKSSALKKQIWIRRAKPANLVSTINISGRHLSLISMGARQNRRGVTVRRLKTGGRTVLKSAFVATMPSGHVGVFRRKGKARLPIQEQFGPSVISLWSRRQEAITRHAINTLQKELKRQIKFYRDKK